MVKITVFTGRSVKLPIATLVVLIVSLLFDLRIMSRYFSMVQPSANPVPAYILILAVSVLLAVPAIYGLFVRNTAPTWLIGLLIPVGALIVISFSVLSLFFIAFIMDLVLYIRFSERYKETKRRNLSYGGSNP